MYFILGWSGLTLATLNNYTSPIWAPSGLAIGALIIFGSWLAPAVFLGALLTNLTVGTPLMGLLGLSTGNMLEAMIGAQLIKWMLRRYHDNSNAEFYALILGGALAASVSASVGVSSLYLLDVINAEDFLYTWYTWLSGDAVGILIVLPLFLDFYLAKKQDRKVSFRQLSEAFCISLLLIFGTWLVFTQGLNQALCWIMTPVFILSGLRFGQLLTRGMLILVSMPIVYLTLTGYSPFELGNLNLNFIHVQSLLASYSFGILFIRPFSTQFKISRKFIFGIFVGWTFIFFVIYAISRLENYFLMKDFNKTVDSAITTIIETGKRHELLLISSESLFDIKPLLTQKDWEEHVSSLNLPSAFRGVRGLGYISRLEKKDYKRWSKEMRDRGVTGLYIKTIDKEYSDKFSDHFVISFIDPMNNFAAFGIDIGSEKMRREAAELSLKKNAVISTSPIQLVSDDKKRPGFLVMLPIVTNGKSQGWVYAPVVSESFFNEALSQYTRLIRPNIWTENQRLFGDWNPSKENNHRKAFRVKRTFTIFNRIYEAQLFPTNEFFIRHSGNTGGLALLLNLFMLFISAFVLEQITYGHRSERLIKERTEELEASKEQLIQSSKMATLGRMVSGVAHEINNPLAIILMKIKVISVMLDDLNVKDIKIKDEIDRVTKTTLRIENIVKGLKSFSRLSIEDPFIPLSLRTIIQESLDLSTERLRTHRIELRLGSMPEVFILTRHGQLAQVILNLLNNAVDAIEGQNEKWVALDFGLFHSKIQISITDSGKGISQDIANKIMDPFYTTKEAGKGTGLGLSIAKGIVEDHGGNLWLEESSEFTKFVFEVPIFKETEAS